MNKKKLISYLLGVLFIVSLMSIFYSVFGQIDLSSVRLSDFFYNVAQFLALTGFLFISILIISGDLARIFDKYFGIDVIIKAQRKFAIITYFIVFSHPFFIFMSQKYGIKYLIPDFSVLPLAFGAISLYIFAGVMISSLLYKRVSYAAWQYIHVLTYVLFFFIWYHGFNIGSSVNEIPIKIMFYTLPVLVVIGIVYRTNYKLRERKNRFILKEIRRETEEAFTLIVEGNKPVSFEPGQFFFLRLNGRKLYARHPFSVANATGERDINFTMKMTGRFTKAAYNLKPGDEIKIEGPFGNFVLDDDGKKPVFIAGGVGITPFMSMIKENQKKAVKKEILLLYASKTEKDIIFKKELDAINENWLKKIYFLSRETEDRKKYELGRINKEMLIKYVKDFKNKKFYICGPEQMNKDVSMYLKELGVKKEDVVFEDFFW